LLPESRLTLAKASNMITREALTSVQRAFVSFIGAISATKTVSGNKNTDLVLILPWQNLGVTPTKNARSRVNWKTFPGDMPTGFDFADIGTVEPRQFEIPPKEMGNATMTIPIGWIDATKKGNVHLFVWGWITYYDIFANIPMRLSEFFDEITDIKSSPDDITDASANITWQLSLCRVPHNCSDEQCQDYRQKAHAER
jgi:hypothetical protein